MLRSLIQPWLDGRRCPASLHLPPQQARPVPRRTAATCAITLAANSAWSSPQTHATLYSSNRRGVELSRSTNRPTPHLGGTSGAFYLPRALDAPGTRRYPTVVSGMPRLTALIHDTGCGHAVAALQTRTMALLQSSGSCAPPSFVQSISRSVFANCSSPRCSRYPPHASTSRVACATY